MRKLWIIVSFICCCSCKTNKENKIIKEYVQTADIQLTNPRIKVDNVIIDTSSTITASLQLEKGVIYYTNDGSEPTEASNRYIKPISVVASGIYSFIAFHPDFKSSEIEKVFFYQKGLDINDISLITPLNEKYTGQGKSTLVNHKKGSLDFRDGQWIGVTEPIAAIIDFKETVFLESIDIGYVINTDAWIFPIQEITIAFSKDGVHFVTMDVSETTEKLTEGITKQDNLHIPIIKELKKIRIEVSNTMSIPEWHQGNGNPAWLFMDEWIFNTRKN